MDQIKSLLTMFLGPDKLASYTRGAVASAFTLFVGSKVGMAICTFAPDVCGPVVQNAVNVIATGIVIGIWGHAVKATIPSANPPVTPSAS